MTMASLVGGPPSSPYVLLVMADSLSNFSSVGPPYLSVGCGGDCSHAALGAGDCSVRLPLLVSGFDGRKTR